MKMIVAWLGQVLLWVRVGWPFAVAVWEILRDGRITLDEAHDAVRKAWPRDELGMPKVVEVPLLRRLKGGE